MSVKRKEKDTGSKVNMPTETENEQLENLFLAVFFNDTEKVIEFKNQFPEIYAKKGNFMIDDNVSFDLTNLTFFNQTIWNVNDWKEEIMPLIKKNKQQTEQMLDFWRLEFDCQNLKLEIEYNQYGWYFFCSDPNDNDEILMEPISDLLEKGFREIDLRLYNRVLCFDFAETKKLLKKGAKANVDIFEDEISNALDDIDVELHLYAIDIIRIFKNFEEKGYEQDFDIINMFGCLLGFAAHKDMYKLLKEYE